jgi:two-component system, OmpR family, phosphate regulon sensor histidine kinase PhoR
MKYRFTIISIILTVIIILPALFFSGYEVTRINNYERDLENVYKKQLDAILFSINQYSEDVISKWTSRISAIKNGNENCETYKEIFTMAPQIRSIIQFNKNEKKPNLVCVKRSEDQERIVARVEKLLSDSNKKVIRLARYITAGYQKSEPLGINTDYPSIFIVFMATSQDNNVGQVFVMEIDEERFIKELLGQKIQGAVEDEFTLGIVNSRTKSLIYPVDTSKQNTRTPNNFQIKKSLWLFPQYEMGIKLKGKTLEVLSKERTRSNLIMIVIVDIIFILGALLIFRNLRKEMKLTLIKSDFISNVSHEIRTPLALISMYIETLEMGRIKSEEKKNEYYQIIYSETQRLSGLVNKILNFSKLESGKRQFAMQQINLNDLVEDVMHSYRFHLNSKGFEQFIKLDNHPLYINGDKEALSDCIVNLLDNAIKYSKEIKSVEIKTGTKSDYSYVEVADRGIGIAKEDHRLIFDKFYRVSKGDNVYEVKGTGLGLTIVKSIVDAHKGKIEVESKPGEGSTFRLLIPNLSK